MRFWVHSWKGIFSNRHRPKLTNSGKTANTNLHVLEAFTNLYTVWPDPVVQHALEEVAAVFKKHIVNVSRTGLYGRFTTAWQPRIETRSYGHDIEFSWLLTKAFKALRDERQIQSANELSLSVAADVVSHLMENGALPFESDSQGIINRHRIWWVQAEAVVGFWNAWEISGDEAFKEKSLQVWQYVQEQIIDHEQGEWHWGRDENENLLHNKIKASMWKTPYHNARMCLEIMQRIGRTDY